MEPNKTEQDFKQKLEQRTIQPSEMAWDRLDAMLSVAENKKPKKNRMWMYMAASFLVFLLAGALLLKQENKNNDLNKDQNGVVTTDSQPKKNINEPIINENPVFTPALQQESVVSTIHETNVTVKKATTQPLRIKEEKVTQSQVQEQIASTDTKQPQSIIEVKDAEQLLAIASDNTVPKKRATVKVDPNSLLSSVEGELTESYRSKAFQGVIKSFNTVKVAVANRNRE